MPLDSRILIMFGANALLLHLALLVNSTLGAWSLYLFLLGPMVVLPALYLRHQSYFACTLLTGLWVDSALPSAYGTFTLGFLLAGTLIFLARVRFRTEHNYHPILLAHGCNFFFIILLTLVTGTGFFGNPAFWMHVSLTAVLSHLALLIIAPWFFNLQRQLFEIFHLETEPEDFPIL